MRTIRLAASILVIIGALNWGLVALANFDLVAWIAGLSFGSANAFSRLVYALVAISGVFLAASIVGEIRHHAHRPATA